MDHAKAADQLTQLSQELGMYDTQLDENKREDLAELIADRLLEYADMKDLEQFYWNAQYEWATDISEEELLETAERLNIEI